MSGFLSAINGHKMNTGMAIVIVTWVLTQMGATQTDAAALAAQIIAGIGAVITVIGYIHKLIKATAKPSTPVVRGK